MLVVILFAALAGVLSVASAQNANLTCGEPPDIQFAFVSNVTDEEYAPGAIVTYACKIGYGFSGGSRTIYCDINDSGDAVQWSEKSFFCAPRACGDPGHVDNARRRGYRFTFPNSVKYECDEGFKIKGLPTRYCQASGLWSGNLPTCNIVSCNQPKEITNGHVTYNSLKYGSELRYTCKEGFKLQVDGAAYCTADGQWSKHSVECVESRCDFPVAPDHGTVTLSNYDQVPRPGTIAKYVCEGDRVAYGQTTSKCQDDGQWLFPAPECLSPCSVPNISNGKLGSYQRRTRYGGNFFYEISAGTIIEDDQELVLRCSPGYEIGDTEKRESEISCSRGKWSLKPHCKPASCRLDPPHLENAEIEKTNTEHGGKVIYRCLENFKRMKDENVVCEFGSWKSYLSNICESTRCSRHKLNFPGLRKGNVASYKNGHLFQIACESDYNANDEAELRCSEGDWKANVAPCVPADCAEPPAIPYTTVEKASTSHGSYATYACLESYKMIGDPRVQCLFGEWGNLPRCDDGRCDIKDLTHSSHISREVTPLYVYSGQDLHVTCKEGYSPRLVTPHCLDGQWMRNSRSPCREDDCLVPKIEHGDIIDKVYGDLYWDWWEARYVREVEYKTVPFGTLSSPGTIYHLHCDSGYYFQGSADTKRKLTCTEANWQPYPVCIPRGSGFKSVKSGILSTFNETTSRLLKSLESGFSNLYNKTTSFIQKITPGSEVSTQSQKPCDSGVTQLEVVTTEFTTIIEPVQCSCQYPVNNENVVATVDGRQLHFLDKVKDGSVVVFKCLHIGYHRFRGPRAMKCENCQNWNSSEFPTCSKPSLGDTIIVFQRNSSISADGRLEVQKGQQLTLWCIAYEGGTYPNWTVPTPNGVTFSTERKVREDRGDVLYMTLLKIENADLGNEGAYYCSIKDQPETTSTLTVTVIDPNVQCPEFEKDDEIHVSYNNGRRVKSTATFSCNHQAKELKGRTVVECLTNGNWSDPPPQCLRRKCKMLKETGQLKIAYLKDREIGSLATFHCDIGAKRTGVSYAECMENGSWSHPTPACNHPPCSLDDIYYILPQGAVPDRHNIQNSTLPYHAEITLTCKDGLIGLGDPVAKCEKNGTWIIRSFRCGSGCPAVEKAPGSILKVEPKKDVYSFGETVQFSCPSGMNLTTDLQQIICLINGWSETTLPDCAEEKITPGT